MNKIKEDLKLFFSRNIMESYTLTVILIVLHVIVLTLIY